MSDKSDYEASLEASIAKLVEALKPFAAIKPSGLYPADGSEAEEYMILLRNHYASNKCEFTGTDLARARQAIADQEGCGA